MWNSRQHVKLCAAWHIETDCSYSNSHSMFWAQRTPNDERWAPYSLYIGLYVVCSLHNVRCELYVLAELVSSCNDNCFPSHTYRLAYSPSNKYYCTTILGSGSFGSIWFWMVVWISVRLANSIQSEKKKTGKKRTRFSIPNIGRKKNSAILRLAYKILYVIEWISKITGK